MKSLPDNPRILLIRFSSLGDVVKCTALPRLIRARWPGARITFLTSEAHLELLRDNPHLERAIGFRRRTGLRGLLRLARELRGEGFHLVADVHRSLRSRVLTALLNAPRTRYGKRTLQRWLLIHWRWNSYGAPYDDSTADSAADSAVDSATPGKEADFLAALRPWGVEDDGRGTELYLASLDGDAELARRFARHFGSEQARIAAWKARGLPVLGVAPVAAWELKRWPMAHYRALLEGYAAQTGGAVVIFGGPEDHEAAALAETLGERAISLVGRASRMESAWFAAQCGLMLSNDTGMSHIAEAVGSDAVVLFGATTRELGYFPVRPGSRVVERALSCRPCTRTGSGRCIHPWPKACLEAIPPEEVLALVLERLALERLGVERLGVE